jgi:opacity protein-like surface antigen
MSSRTSILRGLILPVAALCAAMPAEAADLGSFFSSPQTEAPTQPVDFGTGWYIRGDVGGALQDAPNLLSDAYNVNFSQKLNWSVDIGAGYQFNQWFRADATYTYYGTYPTNGSGPHVNCPSAIYGLTDESSGDKIGVFADGNTCTPKEQASLQKNLFLANGYIDLGNWSGVTPYVGAGIGTAYLNATQTTKFYNDSDGSPYRATLTLPDGYPPIFYSPIGTEQGSPLNPQPHYNYGAQNWDYSRTTYKWNFAFALMAGISYDISTNLKLDLGYRYVNFGTMSFKSLSGSLFDKGLSSQEVRLGLRYLVD